MYKVFTDFHHAGLLQSLILLFEKRLGGRVYRPIGIEWADAGYWKVFDHPATRLQYLTYDQGYKPQDGTRPLNIFEGIEDGVYYCHDIDSDSFNRAISLEKFMKMDIDIVIASLPQHIYPFQKLCEAHPRHPKLIYQIGNAWDVHTTDGVRNVMASAYVNVPDGINAIVYHQEFDESIFCHTPPTPAKNVTSLVNCFNIHDMYLPDWQMFQDVERLMPDWSFKSLGGQCRDGSANGNTEVADAIKRSRFVWHTKAGGDGYGHIVHNTGAIGRPLIFKRSQYMGKMGGELMMDGKTGLDIEGLSAPEVANKILYFSDEERYGYLCANMRNEFEGRVNFATEATRIATWLEMLQ